MRRMTLLVGAVVAVLVAVLFGSACGGGDAAVPKPRLTAGLILFTRMAESGESSLFVIAPDGRGLRRLVANAQQGAVSPDGRQIAFVRMSRDGGDTWGDIWVARSDGSGARRLTSSGSDASPAWGADSHSVYYTHGSDINVMRDDGSQRRRLVRGRVRDDCSVDSPAPSPQGDVVLYVDAICRGRLSFGLAAVTPSGKPTTLPFRLPHPQGTWVSFGRAAWSPDGNAIAYPAVLSGDDDSNPKGSGIFVSPSRTGQPRRIVSYSQTYLGTRFPSEPSWSPDGEWIVFAWSGELSGELWLVRANGSQRHQLTKRLPLTDDSNPVWLPSGS